MKNKSKIRILMISSSSALGGGVKHMFTLGENLKNDFEIFYALPYNDDFSEYLKINNHINISERKLSIKDILKLYKFIKINSIDILHAHGKGAGLITRIVNVFLLKKLIYTFHGIHCDFNNLFLKNLYIQYENLMGKIDTKKIFVSKSEMKFAKSLSINLNNSVVINNGVENKIRIKLLNNKIKEDTPKKFNVISICRLETVKNINEILRIAKLIPHIDFTILGDGQLWNDLNHQIFVEKIENVFLKGKKENIFEYLYSSDVFLSTSLYEGLPLSVLEAMSIGLPIIASNVRGNSDTIVNEKTGYLYELNNTNMAANFIKILEKDYHLKKQMGRSALSKQRKDFSLEKMLKKYQNLYEEVFNKNN
tara:strand:+ start:1816 stop:2910 length:1095 start_codon:yes stop_codon:yes gene_type:complete